MRKILWFVIIFYIFGLGLGESVAKTPAGGMSFLTILNALFDKSL